MYSIDVEPDRVAIIYSNPAAPFIRAKSAASQVSPESPYKTARKEEPPEKMISLPQSQRKR
jgi:hypothetical protein